MITWNISPAVSQYNNSPITVVINGLAALEKLNVLVSTPDGDCFKWKVQANDTGKLSEQLFLASGTGRYLLEIEGCKDLPPVSIVAGCCAPEDTVCGLELFVSRSTLQLGNPVEVDVIGASPLSNVYVYKQFGAATAPVAIKANAEGRATQEFVLGVAGVYSFFASQEDCAAESKQVLVVGNINELETLETSNCAGTVKVTPGFLESRVSSGLTLAVVINVANSSNISKLVNLSVPAPAGFTVATPIQIVNEPIPANSSRDFTFYLTSDNATETELTANFNVTAEMGSYQCEGATYPIIGGNALMSVAPTQVGCGIEVTQLSFNLTNVAKGQAAILMLKVKNIGLGRITNLSLISFLPPAALGTQPLEFNGVELMAGQEYTYSKALIAGNTTALTAVLTIPAGQITAVCQGNTVSTVQSRTTSVNLTV